MSGMVCGNDEFDQLVKQTLLEKERLEQLTDKTVGWFEQMVKWATLDSGKSDTRRGQRGARGSHTPCFLQFGKCALGR
jgi:hypothetical protein